MTSPLVWATLLSAFAVSLAQPNDLLLVLEAMKMETNVTSPVAGKVKRVTVAQSDGVQLNQVLVEFE